MQELTLQQQLRGGDCVLFIITARHSLSKIRKVIKDHKDTGVVFVRGGRSSKGYIGPIHQNTRSESFCDRNERLLVYPAPFGTD